MAFAGALTMALALVASTAGERLLLCRPRLEGDPALARGEAVTDAARALDGRFLDYGVACEDAPEAARAARRAGLGHAVAATAEGRAAGSRYVLVLADAADERTRAERAVEVPPGADAVRSLRAALDDLLRTLPPPPGVRPAHVAAWGVVGTGVAALAMGTLFALQAGDAAGRANGANDPASYARARSEWRDRRRWSAAGFAGGGVLVAAGLTWRFVF